jgi:hypothetical protein
MQVKHSTYQGERAVVLLFTNEELEQMARDNAEDTSTAGCARPVLRVIRGEGRG